MARATAENPGKWPAQRRKIMENGPRNAGKSWKMVSTLAGNSQHGLGGRGVVRSNVGGSASNHGVRVGVGFR